MLANETDKLLGHRLETLERGVKQLDGRVMALDDKVSHVIQMNSELMIQSNENFREIRGTLDSHRSEMRKSIKQIRGRWSTQCYVIGFAVGLTTWTIFMAWVLWH
jgi:hypothetical protein|tara:strand:+ start:45 stop:359 length:315 start_codon:yes stop_codon:yes gene_type:complete